MSTTSSKRRRAEEDREAHPIKRWAILALVVACVVLGLGVTVFHTQIDRAFDGQSSTRQMAVELDASDEASSQPFGGGVESRAAGAGSSVESGASGASDESNASVVGAMGGAAALMAQCVTSLEVIAWDDLGPESVKRLTLRDLPLVVAADWCGGDAFTLGRWRYLNKKE